MAIQTPPEAGLEPHTEKHLSHSQLDLMKKCEWRWYLKYVKGLDERPNLNLARGSAGHTALEKDSKRKLKTGSNITTEEMLDTFSDAFDAETSILETSDLEPGDDLNASKVNTAEILRVYSQKTAPAMKPAAVEFAINHVVPPSEVYDKPILVLVRMDLLEVTGLYDNKFPSSYRGVKPQAEADMSWQLSLYDQALHSRFGIDTPNLGYIQFQPATKNEPPKVIVTRRAAQQMTPERRQARRDRIDFVIQQTQRKIDAGLFVPTDDPRTCSYCPYRDRCQNSLVKDDFQAATLREQT